VLEEFILKAGATKGRDLHLEARRIRSRASRDEHGDVVWLDFLAPYRHIVVTSALTNTIVPQIGVRFPFPGSLALGAQHAKIDADLRISASLGTSSVQSVYDYYHFVMEDVGRLAPMAAEPIDRLSSLVTLHRFLGKGVADFRSLRFDTYVCPHAKI
jgi:hypothetical protein